MKITVIAGGVGSAKFLAGLLRLVPGRDVTIIVNTGDDERVRGLHISPDVDTCLYHLAGRADWARGWGILGDTFEVNDRYARLARASGFDDAQEWFGLGNADLATHMLRTRMLDVGRTLSDATAALARGYEVGCTVLPMSNDPVRTVLIDAQGERLAFQEYFVRRQQDVDVCAVEFVGSADAKPAPGTVEAIAAADVLLIPPSNPLVTIAPILAISAIRDAIASHGRRIGISPIVGGHVLKGPLARLMKSLGHETSSLGVARIYAGLLDILVIDHADQHLAAPINAAGMGTLVADTVMRSAVDAARLAGQILPA